MVNLTIAIIHIKRNYMPDLLISVGLTKVTLINRTDNHDIIVHARPRFSGLYVDNDQGTYRIRYMGEIQALLRALNGREVYEVPKYEWRKVPVFKGGDD